MMVERDHPSLSVSCQCRLLELSRSVLYYQPVGESPETLALMRRIDELYLSYPFYGSRQMMRHLAREGVTVGRHRVRRLSNTMDTEFCLESLTEALGQHGTPEIFNTDQGSQFTSTTFTAALEDAGIRCSMDGRGRCLDNAFIERLWRSLKYEAVYLHELADGFAAQRVIADWIDYYRPSFVWIFG